MVRRNRQVAKIFFANRRVGADQRAEFVYGHAEFLGCLALRELRSHRFCSEHKLSCSVEAASPQPNRAFDLFR